MGQSLGYVRVLKSNVAIRESFGKFDGVLQPGFHFVPFCTGKIIAGFLSTRDQQLVVRCRIKTKDNLLVTVVTSIRYRALVEKARDAFYKLSSIKHLIHSSVSDVISGRIPLLNLHQVFEKKDDIAKFVKEVLEEEMSMYGYQMIQALIENIEFDAHGKQVLNEMNAAAREMSEAIEKAEAEKIIQIKHAEGDAESKSLAAAARVSSARQNEVIVDS